MMGLSADTLGNHNFDRGSAYLRQVLIPLADYPYLASNVVYANNNKLPPEWKASQVFNFGGFKLGVIGFTLPELPSLIFPGYLDPFMVTDPALAINTEAARLRSKSNVNAVIAVGHMGLDGTSVTDPLPSSELLLLAQNLVGVDALFGGHTHSEYITYLKTNPNQGMLVTESPNSGTRFNRIRLTIDTNTKKVVYTTADFHKPWDIGITADPAIQVIHRSTQCRVGSHLQHGRWEFNGNNSSFRFLWSFRWSAMRIKDW